MTTRKDKIEVFIQIKGVGFMFLLDKKMKHNLINPALLAFFNIGKKQRYPLSENNIEEVNTKPTYDNDLPFLFDYVNSISLDDIFYYVGKRVGRCQDNKLRVCKVFMLRFEYEGCTFSFPFLLDKSLDEPAILSRESFNHITKTVMKHKAKT